MYLQWSKSDRWASDVMKVFRYLKTKFLSSCNEKKLLQQLSGVSVKMFVSLARKS